MTVFFVVSGVGQAMAGFWVDRWGAMKVLMAGMSCFALAALVLAVAHSYGMLFLAAGLAGLGNSVFHPADFTVLNRHVSTPRLGHAFSVHGLSGNLGWAAAPVFLTNLAAWADWRVAAALAALVPVPIMLLLWFNRSLVADLPGHAAKTNAGTSFDFLKSGPVWLCLVFFFLITAAFGAIQSFTPTILQSLYAISLHQGAAILSVYMLAAAGGIVVGGFVAQKSAHEWQVAISLAIAALCAVLVATQMVSAWGIVFLMAGVGFFTGIAGPSRDLLVRRAATARF
ncbi:MAG TPA: MFS transporter, partial [Rhodocyclaceae bacterium]|nr:MFS transporter [Rhodocyclaceae bacterium]